MTHDERIKRIEEMIFEAISDYRGRIIDALLLDLEKNEELRYIDFVRMFPALSKVIEQNTGDGNVNEL